MKRTLSIFLFSLGMLSACAGPTPVTVTPTSASIPSVAPTSTPAPSATFTAQPVTPTNTPGAISTSVSLTASPPANGSPTPAVPTVYSSNGKDAQCYTGPGIEYKPDLPFKIAEIVGKGKTGAWWYIKFYDKLENPHFCWANAQSTITAGNLSNVPMTESETASITNVDILVNGGNTQTIDCGQGATKPEFHFNGEIAASGPLAKLRYQWITDAEEKFDHQETQILSWDAPARFEISLSVPAQAGTYSLTLRTISPNEMVKVVQFKVKCR